MARSKAIRWIKQSTFVYLEAGQKPIKVDLELKDKASHGLNHPDLGWLLIPAERLHDWDPHPKMYVNQSKRSPVDNFPSVRDEFNTRVLKIWGRDMPTFLYEDYMYNPNDPEEGLFRGPFLVCVSANSIL
jgi:hypothetical protein